VKHFLDRPIKWEWYPSKAPLNKNMWFAQWRNKDGPQSYKIRCGWDGTFTSYWVGKQIGAGGLPTFERAKQLCEYHAERIEITGSPPQIDY
jgi:hypothetical protein